MIVGKICFSGTLELKRPAIIGSGKSENSDIDILRNSEGMAFIPATSFVGVLKNHIVENEEDKNLSDLFWGFSNENISEKQSKKGELTTYQSSLVCSDLNIKNKVTSKINTRDGIKIDASLGTVKDKSKYDYEIIESGTQFEFTFELPLLELSEVGNKVQKDGKDLSSFKNELIYYSKFMIVKINETLDSDIFSIGAKTNNGFGKIKLVNSNIQFYDYKNLKDILNSLKNSKNEKTISIEELAKDENVRKYIDKNKTKTGFKIMATFAIENSFIIRSYSNNPRDPDSVHIKSTEGKNLLIGSSLKGAIRSRAEKILWTIGYDPTKEPWKNFFGHEGIEGINREKMQAHKSRLSVTESFFENKPNEELQSRIKIDRFTGGTIEGALFDSMPLFQNKDNTASVIFEINIRDFENDRDKAAVGLLLLVLKDLWTGDLPIGGEKNVGRGRLRGVDATITWDDKKVVLKSKDKEYNLPDVIEGNWEELEKFVSELNGLVGKS
ncbi:MAG: hypothetical protein KA146_02280 [Leptospiraceae bacterium]|nr:hypothetical protein [Leptospiraceae bacterium]